MRRVKAERFIKGQQHPPHPDPSRSRGAGPLPRRGEGETPRCILIVAACFGLLALSRNLSAAGAEAPKIDYVEPLRPQPFARDTHVIWYDDFDDDRRQLAYAEKSGNTTVEVRLGKQGKSLRMHYPKGHRGIGNRKLFFGDSPVYPDKTVKPGRHFTDVYWRIYVKHPRGWTGGSPAKMSRATSLTSARWQQAMIAHVWGSRDSVTLDPASGVRGAGVVTRMYNDFRMLRWLGNNPSSPFPIHAPEEAGRWVCVESRAKLNAPGKSDGCNALWIDGLFQTDRKDLDWAGSYVRHGINAVFLEAYWNRTSPATQSRYYDEFVVSTEPIGPVYAPPNPELVKTPSAGPGRESTWEAEIAVRLDGEKNRAVRMYSSDTRRQRRRRWGPAGTVTVGEDVWGEVVWKSRTISGDNCRLKVDHQNGSFTGSMSNHRRLDPGKVYFCRLRQKTSSADWSSWSNWHQPFQTPN